MSFFKLLLPFVLLPTALTAHLPIGVFKYSSQQFSDISLYNTSGSSSFIVYDDSFLNILGTTPTLNIILNSTNSSFTQFHEAGIFMSGGSNPVLFVTSNQYAITNSNDTNNKAIAISRVSYDGKAWSATVVSPTVQPLHLANGGAKFSNTSIVILDQGSLTKGGGVSLMNTTAPFGTTVLLDSYLGIQFNSPNDIFVTRDKSLWFTDPTYGNVQGIRPAPKLPPQIYRYVPGSTDVRVVADGLIEPNGLTFSPDEMTAYITDGTANLTVGTNPRAIYAFDVQTNNGQPYLTNKRIFAMPQVGIPDGIKVDSNGNVYAGCGDGLNVWNAQGVLLGKVIVSTGVANFAIGDAGQLFLLAEDKIYLAQVSQNVSLVTNGTYAG